VTAPALSPPPGEQTHYWAEDPDGWCVQVVSDALAGAVPPARTYRAYVSRDGRRVHKTPWGMTEEGAWLDGRALIATERRRAQRGPWWRRALAALRASIQRWRAP
jgi:hypothetical protein